MLFRNATIYTMEQDPFVGDLKSIRVYLHK